MLIFDNIHGYIEISDLAKQFIDTTEFQRLRHIHQTGALSFVFPTAVHKRFEHSIGTYHLTGQMMSNLNKKQPNVIDKTQNQDYHKEMGFNRRQI